MIYNKELTHNAIKYSYSIVFKKKNIKTFDTFLNDLQRFIRYNEQYFTEQNIESEDFILMVESFYIPNSQNENFFLDFKTMFKLRPTAIKDYVYRYLDSMIHVVISRMDFFTVFNSSINELLYIGRPGTMFDHTPIDSEHDPWHTPLRGGMFDFRPVRYDD